MRPSIESGCESVSFTNADSICQTVNEISMLVVGCNSDRLVSVVFNALIKDTSNTRIPRKIVCVFRGYPEAVGDSRLFFEVGVAITRAVQFQSWF